MSEAFRGYKPKEFIIESHEGQKIDITNSILGIDYFEDILTPSVNMAIQVTNRYSIVSELPIRGGEKVYVDIETASGDFTLNSEDDVMRVYKVSGLDGTKMAETFNLHLTTPENFNNELSRSYKRYSGKISDSVKKILSEDFIRKFKGKILNIHPSLLPKYKGLKTHERVIKNKEKYSGCTVHLVNSKLDSGKIILQKRVKLSKKETSSSLQLKILKQEHILYPRAIDKIFANR